MITTNDLLKLVNSPVEWSSETNYFCWAEDMQNRRLAYDILDRTHIRVKVGNSINWGMALDWGEEKHIQTFLHDVFCGKIEVVESLDFVEKQKSIPRMQDDQDLILKTREESSHRNKYSVWNKGCSAYLSYGAFRATINKGYKDKGLFQKAILKAIDTAYYPFCNWFGWGNKNGKDINKERIYYYDLEEDVRKFADIVRNTTLGLIQGWMLGHYDSVFVEECFNGALSDGWNSWQERLGMDDGRLYGFGWR